MAYLLDSNVFIQAKNLHYGFDFCPGFWDWLQEQHAAGTVYSVEKVGTELAAGADDLSRWAVGQGARFFVPPDAGTATSLATTSQWATTQGYTPAAINTFLQVADLYLVAHALAHGHVVVTHETPAQTPNRVKIPNACIGLGVTCMSPFEMLRTEQARFIKGP